MSATVEMLPVYYVNRRHSRGKPDGYIDREGAYSLIESGLAEWMNKKCKSIRVLRTESELPPCAQSLIMGPEVMQGACDGNQRYVAMVESWRFGWDGYAVRIPGVAA